MTLNMTTSATHLTEIFSEGIIRNLSLQMKECYNKGHQYTPALEHELRPHQEW
jgi:hypothetical protein